MGGYVPKPKLTKLDFKGTEYEGLEATVSLSVPYGALEDLKGGDENKILDVITYMLKDWNLCDMKTGEPLGPPSEETVRKASIDVLMAIFEKAMESMQIGGLSKNAELPSDDS